MGERLGVLLPVRNGEHLLPGWLASVEHLADEVIALDDGSTDGTVGTLESHPLVTTVLRNPVRTGFAGWDDHTNRQALVDAAVRRRLDWALFLDADERVAPPDLSAVRALVREADPGLVYGMSVHAASDDLRLHDPVGRFVYRLFALDPHPSLLPGRLHAPPVPEGVPRRRWLRTRVRLLHVATLDEADRRARRAKYAEADPFLRWQDSYDHLLDTPGALEPVAVRSGPVVLPIHRRPHGVERPDMSVIVIARDEEDRIERCVAAVVAQDPGFDFELIVVASGNDDTAAVVRSRFPEVRVVELDGEALPGAARNAGLAIAGGDLVVFLSAGIELLPGNLAARYAAHHDGWAMVSGPVLDGSATAAGRASYLMEHAGHGATRPEGEMETAPVRCSYVRFLLDEVGGFPEHLRDGEDTVVNTELFERGYSAFFASRARERHRSRIEVSADLLAHHRRRGVAFGQILAARSDGRLPWATSLLYARRRRRRLERRLRSQGVHLDREVRLLIRRAIRSAWRGMMSGARRRPTASATAPGRAGRSHRLAR